MVFALCWLCDSQMVIIEPCLEPCLETCYVSSKLKVDIFTFLAIQFFGMQCCNISWVHILTLIDPSTPVLHTLVVLVIDTLWLRELI